MNGNEEKQKYTGSSTELMPSIMGAFDAIIGVQSKPTSDEPKTSTPKKLHQYQQPQHHFPQLSPCVQKILSNVDGRELGPKPAPAAPQLPTRKSLRSKTSRLGHQEVISTSVQKMLSNLPDAELVICAANLTRNASYLHQSRSEFLDRVLRESSSVEEVEFEEERGAGEEEGERYDGKPLGSYLHSARGIASRTPVGRKSAGTFLQVPNELVSVCTTSSTASSSEVSRPVSLTSLGSCSSSGSSSGTHQPGSAYLASVESLDSDPERSGSQGSADSGIAEQEQISSLTPEQRVLQEVLETEAVYVSDLEEVIRGYLEPWREDPDCPHAQHLQHLFSNLEEICKFNRSFLESLREANCDPTRMANCFLQHDSGFRVYNDYCADYPRTMEVLGELTRDEAVARSFREKQVALGHPLPLGSYLLKPVQRILKYHLLLQRLSKQCSPAHQPAVDLALTTMTGVASDINTMKRKHEHAVRVQELQSQLYGWNGPDLAALGELIAEGTFRMVGARGRRHVLLFEKVLVMSKSKQDGALGYKGHIMCSNLMLVEQVRGEPLSFQVLPFDNPRLQSTLKARSPQHKREWTLQIKRVILENYSAVIPNHARQLVLQLGQDLNASDYTADKWSSLKITSPPHYLERRSRVRKTRDFSVRRASSQDRTFPSLSSWRRKSEPDMIPQYTTKTMPKKITKIKKAKEIKHNATFYTDLSDSDVIDESTESLPVREEEEEEDPSRNNLERIVSDILMQNQSFQKAFRRQGQRKNVTSDPVTSVWYEDKVKLPTKADSLPRSFRIDPEEDQPVECKNERLIHDTSLKENPDSDAEDRPDSNGLSCRLDGHADRNPELPEHKIYRKSAMRLSILQRIKHIVSEEERHHNNNKQKRPFSLKQRHPSKGTGEKLAHPDYADPQKFIHSKNPSRVDLNREEEEGKIESLDLSLDGDEVLGELEKRLSRGNSSQDPSYYESILEDSLGEGRGDGQGQLERRVVRRPTKAPPPVPAKPVRLTAARAEGGATTRSWVKTMVGRFE